MKLFDSIITDTLEKCSAIVSNTWDYDANTLWNNLPKGELIMQKDQAYELGGGCPSANFTCVTTTQDLVSKDEVVLCGPDLTEISGNVSFARLVLLEIEDIGDKDDAHSAIKEIDYIRYHIFPEGYMTRISAESNQERVRVSKSAIANGINFKAVGNTYIKAYKENENVKHVKIIFLTDQELIRELNQTANKVFDITSALCTIFDDLDLDCASCNLKAVCDEVEGMRELHMSKIEKYKNARR